MTASTLRAALRSRLTLALRERDRSAAATLRAAIATLENAEAVPAPGSASSTTSSHVAGAAIGVGAAEAERRVLGDAEERDLVGAEIEQLTEAEQAFARAGAHDRAEAASSGARLLGEVLGSVDARS